MPKDHFLTFDASLFVLFVNEQVAGRVWEEGEGEKLKEGGKCIDCHENRPESIYSENFSETKPAEREELSNCWPREHTLTQGGPSALLRVSWLLAPRSLQHFSAQKNENLNGRWKGESRVLLPAARQLHSVATCCSVASAARLTASSCSS